MPAATSSSPAPPADSPGGDDVACGAASGAAAAGAANATRWAPALGAAVLSGVLMWAAQAPLEWGPLGFVALVPMLLAATDTRRGLLVGALAGFVYFALLLRWILVFGWFAWLPVVLALTVAVAALGALAGRTRRSRWGLASRVALLPSALVVMEWVRDRWPLNGFTWGEVGAALGSVPFTRAAAALGGVSLLTWLAVAVNVAVADAASGRRDGGRRLASAAGVGAAVAVTFGVAWMTRPSAPPVSALSTAIVQANSFEGRRVDPEVMIDAHLAQTRAITRPVDLVVWGESSLLWADPTPSLARRLSAAAGGAPVIANASVLHPEDPTFENTTVLVAGGEVTDTYVKRHLVPFGEFVPWPWLRGVIGSLSQVPRDAVPGTEPGLFSVHGTVVGTVTCFETVFSDPSRELVAEGAAAFVFTTNNASFRRSDEAAQYLALTRLRASETHRAISVAAVSGSSATIDADGTILQTTPLFEPAVLTWDMPTHDDTTVFVRLGHWPLWLSLGIVALVLGRGGVRRLRHRTRGQAELHA